MPIDIYKFLISILILLSCKADPKNQYSKKTKIGVCQEHQGMVTFEANLYSDSTFYQLGNPLVDYSFGEFRLSRSSITFKTLGGERNFCPEYRYEKESNSYFPIGNCDSDPINIYWMNTR